MQIFKKGDILSKTSKTGFGKNGIKGPLLIVEKFESFGNSRCRVNNTYVFYYDDIQVVSPEEAEKIKQIWEESGIISKILRPDHNTSCFREDNGNPKQKLPDKVFKNILFQAKMRNPNGGYEAYVCETCGSIHIGKTKQLYEHILLI